MFILSLYYTKKRPKFLAKLIGYIKKVRGNIRSPVSFLKKWVLWAPTSREANLSEGYFPEQQLEEKGSPKGKTSRFFLLA